MANGQHGDAGSRLRRAPASRPAGSRPPYWCAGLQAGMSISGPGTPLRIRLTSTHLTHMGVTARRPHRGSNRLGQVLVVALPGADQHLSEPERARTELIAAHFDSRQQPLDPVEVGWMLLDRREDRTAGPQKIPDCVPSRAARRRISGKPVGECHRRALLRLRSVRLDQHQIVLGAERYSPLESGARGVRDRFRFSSPSARINRFSLDSSPGRPPCCRLDDWLS